MGGPSRLFQISQMASLPEDVPTPRIPLPCYLARLRRFPCCVAALACEHHAGNVTSGLAKIRPYAVGTGTTRHICSSSLSRRWCGSGHPVARSVLSRGLGFAAGLQAFGATPIHLPRPGCMRPLGAPSPPASFRLHCLPNKASRILDSSGGSQCLTKQKNLLKACSPPACC